MIWQLFYLAIDITKYDTVKNFARDIFYHLYIFIFIFLLAKLSNFFRAIEAVMNEREKTIEETKDKMNTVEDRFSFRNFTTNGPVTLNDQKLLKLIHHIFLSFDSYFIKQFYSGFKYTDYHGYMDSTNHGTFQLKSDNFPHPRKRQIVFKAII